MDAGCRSQYRKQQSSNMRSSSGANFGPVSPLVTLNSMFAASATSATRGNNSDNNSQQSRYMRASGTLHQSSIKKESLDPSFRRQLSRTNQMGANETVKRSPQSSTQVGQISSDVNSVAGKNNS